MKVVVQPEVSKHSCDVCGSEIPEDNTNGLLFKFPSTESSLMIFGRTNIVRDTQRGAVSLEACDTCLILGLSGLLTAVQKRKQEAEKAKQNEVESKGQNQ
jgi:hypothetical protein